jgi:hypothetical protein
MEEELKVEAPVQPDVAQGDAQVSRSDANVSRSDREYNMRVMREKMEALERRAMEAERVAQERSKPPQQEAEDDALVEQRHLKKTNAEINEMKAELEKTRKQLEATNNSSVEYQLRAKFNDFDRVVTDDNMEKLRQEKPALYRSILYNPDLRDKGETAYDAIQTFLKPAKFAEADKRLAENAAKPRNASTVNPQASDSPLSRVADYDRRSLTKEQMAENRREMNDAKKLY